MKELPLFRKIVVRAEAALLEQVEDSLVEGDFRGAFSLLALLERGSGIVSKNTDFLLTWAMAMEAASNGRELESLAMVKPLIKDSKALASWAASLEKGLAGFDKITNKSIEMCRQGRFDEGAHCLEDIYRGVVSVRALGEAMRAMGARERENLGTARKHLDSGRPIQALELLIQMRSSDNKGEVRSLVERALDALCRAEREIGASRAALASLSDKGALQAMGERLSGAEKLNCQAEGLSQAREAHERASACLNAIEGIRAGLDRGDIDTAVILLADAASPPPKGALAMEAEWRRLLNETVALANEHGLSHSSGALLATVAKEAGLSLHPFFSKPLADPEGIEVDTALIKKTPKCLPLSRGFILRVARGGDLLIIPKDSISVGSVASKEADVRILSRIGALHAEFRRSLSFHKGVEHKIKALGENKIEVNDKSQSSALLKDGDSIRLGRPLSIRFSRPSSGSVTPLLELSGDFEVEGCRRVAWMKEPGWDGAVSIGPGSENHVSLSFARAKIEFSLDKEGRLLSRSSHEIEVDGEPCGKETVVDAGKEIKSEGVVVYIDSRIRKG